ncbi:hypothetical protein M9Y10_010318 [Tritrichomonas musculus]|uniref:Uncharacterized protein n=1 Tax=Tritrichomonas musculus TaxID=1915356 RepID=A0ABR2IKC6_9EUKA
MDEKVSEANEKHSYFKLTFCGALSALDLTPKEWNEAFQKVETEVSVFQDFDFDEFISIEGICYAVIDLAYEITFKSLCDFVKSSEINENSKKTLSGILMLFSRGAAKLNSVYSNSLSLDLLAMANDISLIPKYGEYEFHPLAILRRLTCDYMHSLPSD